MKKNKYVVSLISSALLAPIFLSSQFGFAQTTDETSQPRTENVANENATTANNEATTTNTAPENNSSTNNESERVATNAKDIVILHTNDMHGRLEEDKRGKVMGVAKLDAFVKAEKSKENQVTLLVDAGDALQGLPISNNTKGEDMAGILNQIGYDALAVGNHEFDFGFDQILKYKDILNFPILSANTYVNGVRVFEPATIIDKDKTVTGDEVVVIGVTTPETYTKTHPRNIRNVEFRDPITEVKNVITTIESQARAEGKEYKTYVVIGHLGIDDTTKEEWRGSTMAKELSAFAPLANKNIVMIDGHSHTAFSKSYAKNVAYNQTGNYLNNVGKVTISPDGTVTPTLVSYKDTESLTPSANIAEKVAEIKAKFNQENATVVIENNPVDLNGDRSNVRVRETNIGNAVADALYTYGQTGFKNKTDLAVTNGGGLRDSIRKDTPVTKGNIIAVLPFGNTISQIEVTGEQILSMFKRSLSSVLQKDANGNPVLDENNLPLLEANGGFLHASGVKVYYDTTLDANERILRIDILNKENGKYEPLNLQKTYYLATNDFLAAGGDGYTMLGGAREEGPSMDSVFAEYLKHVDLTKYAVVNPNERIIALSTEAFKQLVAKEDESNVPAIENTTVEITNTMETGDKKERFESPAIKQEINKAKQLPRTGTQQHLSVFGVFSLLFSLVFMKKATKLTDKKS